MRRYQQSGRPPVRFSLDFTRRCPCHLIGGKAGRVRGHDDRLHHELPDRNDRAQNEEGVNHRLDQCSTFIFRLHDHVVSRFVGFHKDGLTLCTQRASGFVADVSG